MRSVLGLFVIRVAEMLDRSLITVPEIDEDFPPFAADCENRRFADPEADLVSMAGRS
jgi:hypothetical protein